jgi:RNA polymerase sigma-70 factor (ECF subfamily)
VSDQARRLAEIETLYRARFPHFLRVAIAITGSYEEALECVQEAFGNAISRHASYRGEGTLEAWVWRLVVNTSRDRRRRRAPPALIEETTAGSNGHVEAAELRVVIARLPERQRLVLFLRYYADLDYRAIAEALEIETGTVSATLSQAHRALRRTFEEVEA